MIESAAAKSLRENVGGKNLSFIRCARVTGRGRDGGREARARYGMENSQFFVSACRRDACQTLSPRNPRHLLLALAAAPTGNPSRYDVRIEEGVKEKRM